MSGLLAALRARPVATATGLATLVFGLCALPATSSAQLLPVTKLATVVPAGGQAGASSEVKITGTDIDGVDTLAFSHPGITAVQVVEEVKGEKKPKAGTFSVSIDTKVPAGRYEVRAIGMYGASNPRTFVVGISPEVAEVEPNNMPDQAQAIEIGQTVNGAMNAAVDVDWYKFEGKKGQRVIATVLAARIDSKMAAALSLIDSTGNRIGYGRGDVRDDPLVDAVLPADGEYRLKLHDFVYAGGADYFYRLEVGTRPYVDFVLPAAGTAGTSGKFTVYGRNLPGGKPSNVTVDGRKLEQLETTIALPKDPAVLDSIDNPAPYEAGLDAVPYSVASPTGISNPTLINVVSTPVVLEQEPNDDPGKAQKLAIPADVTGQFQARGDTDWYEFEAKAKDVLVIEVYGQRLASSLDPVLAVDQVTKGADGKETVKRLTTQDDTTTPNDANRPNPLQTVFSFDSDDPRYTFTAPADGTYRIEVRDRYFEGRGDPRYVYRLSVRIPKPDFRLVAVPTSPPAQNKPAGTSSMALRQGENRTIAVTVLKLDGFDSTIMLTAKGLPKGVTCPPVAIGPGSTSAELVFSAAEDAPKAFAPFEIVGEAVVDEKGTKATRTARPATVAWEGAQNQPGTTHLTKTLYVSVVPEPVPFQLTTDVSAVDANQGRLVLVKVSAKKRAGFDDVIKLAASGLPKNANVTVPAAEIAKGQDSVVVPIQLAANAMPGAYTLSFVASVQFDYKPAGTTDPNVKPKKLTLGSPSTPVVLTVKTAPATLTAAPAGGGALKRGGEVEVKVDVKRIGDFKGPVQLALALPEGIKGLSAAPVTIAPDQTSAVLKIKAGDDAPEGTPANVVVRGEMDFQGKAAVDAAVTLKISK